MKGQKHSDYFEAVVHALMEKRGMSKGKASAIAWGALRRWRVKSKHPEVKAAASGALAEEATKHGHSHARSWDEVAAVIDLASQPVDLVGPHGYIHGWIYVGGPGLPSVAAHNTALRKKGITPPTKAHPALTRKPPQVAKPAASKAAPAAKPQTMAAPPQTAAKSPEPPKMATPAAKAPAAGESAAKLVDDLNGFSAFGGKSVQKALVKKKSLADLHAMDKEYARRGSLSGKVTVAHQLVKDEIASRGATPLPASSPDEMKKAHAAVKTAAKAEAARPRTPEEEKQDLIAAWSKSYRYTGKTEAKSKRTADFATEMHRLLRTNKQPDKCGPGCQDAHKFLTMVDHNASAQHRELQRGITLSSDRAERMFQPGKAIDMPVTSWTSDDHTATSYAKGESKAGKTKVILHAAPGAKGMDIADMSAWENEHEVVSGGRFNVDRVNTTGGVMHVYLTQKDFSAH